MGTPSLLLLHTLQYLIFGASDYAWVVETSEEINKRQVGISGSRVKTCCEALYVHISGVYGLENVSSITKRLFVQLVCLEHYLKSFCAKTNKRGGLNKSGRTGKISKN